MSVAQLEKLELDSGHAGEGGEEEEVEDKVAGEVTKSKKKRKKKKATSGTTANGENCVPEPMPAAGVVGCQKASGKAAKGKKQTTPPSIPIKDLFPNYDFPVGQIMDHPVVDS